MMTRHSTVCTAALLAAILLAAPALLAAAQPDLAALVNSMPERDSSGKYTGPDPATARRAIEAVLAGGKPSVLALAKMLLDPGQGEDYKARYLLHALMTHVSRPGAEPERALACEALLPLLAGATPKGIQAKVLEELKWAGGRECVEPVGRLLLDDALHAEAAAVLEKVGGTEAVFRQALGRAAGGARVSIIQALGRLRDAEAAPAIRAALADAEAGVRIAAAAALANIGDPAAASPLLAATRKAEGHEQIMATEASFVLAKRLLEAGRAADAETIYRAFWEGKAGGDQAYVRASALQGLAASRSDGAVDEVMKAAKSEDILLRAAAARIAATQPGEAYTRRWLGELKTADADQRVGILDVLGQRRDPAALPEVLALISDQDAAVRGAALRATSRIGGPPAAKALIGILLKGQGDESASAQAGLIQMAGGEDVDRAVAAAAAPSAPAGARAALLAVLAARGATGQRDLVLAALSDKNPAVRAAAIEALGALGGEQDLPVLVKVLQNAADSNERAAAEAALLAVAERSPVAAVHAAIIPALKASGPAVVPALLRGLGKAGGAAGYETFVAYADDKDPAIQDAAVRMLAEARDPAAIAPLLKVARKTGNETHQALALRGAVQLARTGVADPDLRIRLFGEVLAVAKRPDERRLAIGAAGDVPTMAALEFVAAQLDSKDVSEEAAAAAVRICQRMSGGDAARRTAVLQKVMEVSQNRRTVSDAAKVLGVSAPGAPKK